MDMHGTTYYTAPFGVWPVRRPSGKPWLIKRALDAGAYGIFIPCR